MTLISARFATLLKYSDKHEVISHNATVAMLLHAASCTEVVIDCHFGVIRISASPGRGTPRVKSCIFRVGECPSLVENP